MTYLRMLSGALLIAWSTTTGMGAPGATPPTPWSSQTDHKTCPVREYSESRGVRADTGNHALPGSLQRQLERLASRSVRRKAVATGSILHVSLADGRGADLAAGRASEMPARPMDAGDRIRAGSVLKTFVATVVLQLVEEGVVSLDDRLGSILPGRWTEGFRHRGEITVAMLLGHTSGLPEMIDDEVTTRILADPATLWPDEVWLRLAANRRQARPGSFAYSNTNYILLGCIIEERTGRPWRQEVRERIIAPLELTDTLVPEPGERAMSGRHARGYERAGRRGRIDVTEIDPSMAGASGGGALVTTARDLATFIRALCDGRVFRDPATFGRMCAWVEAPTEAPGFRRYYGLGVEKYVRRDGVAFIGHGGSTAGYAVAMLLFQESGYVVVAAQNGPDLAAVYFDLALPAHRALARGG